MNLSFSRVFAHLLGVIHQAVLHLTLVYLVGDHICEPTPVGCSRKYRRVVDAKP